MKFGKITELEGVDFSLPKDHEDNVEFFEKTKNKRKLKPSLYLGTTGWANKDWNGIYYPEKTNSSSFLKHYAKMMDSIELNTTHYRIPELASIQRWKSMVNDQFKFCPKIPQSISHRGKLTDKKGLLNNFIDVIQELGESLGICFIQLPDYYGVDKLGTLKHFLESLPSHIPFAVEIRNQNWFSHREIFREFFQFLEFHQISPVLSDVAGRRDVLHQRLSTDKLIIRFVGNSLHSSDFQRLDEWILKLEDWFGKGLNEVHFFFHQPDIKLVPETMNYFIEKSNNRGILPKLKPILKIKPANSQLELF